MYVRCSENAKPVKVKQLTHAEPSIDTVVVPPETES